MARIGNRMAAFAFQQAGLALGNGRSRVLSLYGSMPVITIEPDEQSLVFNGQMGLALSRLDEDIVISGITASAASILSSGMLGGRGK